MFLAGVRASTARILRGDWRGQRDGLAWPGVATAGVLLWLGFFSNTKAEVARLWLFMVPSCCALAANQLHKRCSDNRRATMTAVLALQWLTVLFTKTGLSYEIGRVRAAVITPTIGSAGSFSY